MILALQFERYFTTILKPATSYEGHLLHITFERSTFCNVDLISNCLTVIMALQPDHKRPNLARNGDILLCTVFQYIALSSLCEKLNNYNRRFVFKHYLNIVDLIALNLVKFHWTHSTSLPFCILVLTAQFERLYIF